MTNEGSGDILTLASSERFPPWPIDVVDEAGVRHHYRVAGIPMNHPSADVYEGQHEETQQFVALKIYKDFLPHENEIVVMRELARDPHVVPLVDSFVLPEPKSGYDTLVVVRPWLDE